MSKLGVWLAQQSQSDREYILKYQPRDFVQGLKDFNRYCAWLTDLVLLR